MPEKSNDKKTQRTNQTPKNSPNSKDWKNFIPLQVVKKEKANSSNSNQTKKILREDLEKGRSSFDEKGEITSDQVTFPCFVLE